ncbi:hypothetical protein MPTK1_2g24910 [Marchantia polymorpha subsp. ruderalis]|uniref:Uncharacterized protein n=1 Tax=Marchantia polymorpha TaxID=3197 RepID=A0A2R6W1Y0_MARPO|nr:hypothetical protein MARPO_0181s0006 [Marchantia polymorpha]BBN03618.1 hypothetical protein Mp_2g24910 [Marchantia polymorpha subsp. ruderalis]|eukprot:PTQ27856.1 hypothetical protein MARPO_0181s0006 [Marchantia polymorpha]
MADDVQAMIFYYARIGYGQHIQNLCSKHLQKRPKDAVLIFWHAFGLILEGSYADALQELQGVSEQRDVEVVAVAAMLHAHRLCASVDNEEVEKLEQRLRVVEKCGSERALYLAATLYLYLGGTSNVKKAKELTAKILQIQPHYVPFECLSAWIGLELESERKKTSENTSQSQRLDSDCMEASLHVFDEVLGRGNCIDALIGRAYYYELKDEFAKAIDELNQVIVAYPWYLPALCEKGRLGMLLQDWDLVQETSQLILQRDPHNIEGLRLTIHVMLCIGTEAINATNVLDKLLRTIEERETCNGNLCLQVSAPLARIAGRGCPSVLRKTLALIKRAEGLLPKHAQLFMEMADQNFLVGDYKAALENYRLASQLDELSMEPMYGSVQCLLVLGEVEEAEQQLELLVEISVSMGKSASLCYVMAQLVWKKEKDYSRCRDLLAETIALQSKVTTKRKDYRFYTELNPDRLRSIANLFLVLSRYVCKGICVDRSFCLQQSVLLLELVLDIIPGHLTGYLMLAEVQIQLDEFDSAQCTLQAALGLDHTFAAAQLLLSQVQVQLKNFDTARQSLEQALSDNFMVRETVKYHVIQAHILLHYKENEEALKVLESAMFLQGMKQVSTDMYEAYYSSTDLNALGQTADSDRVLVYLLLADVHMRFGHTLEATKTIQDAMNEFMGTPEEAQVVIASAKLALQRDEVSKALAILKQVPVESIYFIKAKVTMADIYINHWHDKAMYANCYRELGEFFPSAKTFLMLGEAYMKVDDLHKGVEAYESAMRESPKDGSVAAQVGKALFTSHNYEKAIEHYTAALQTVDEGVWKLVLYYDLAESYYKLKKYGQAEALLTDMLARADIDSPHKESRKTSSLMLCLKGSLLLSKVQNLLGTSGTLAEVMSSVRNLQSRLLPKLHGQHGLIKEDAIKEQNCVAADIYYQFAKECEARRDLDKTVTLLHEALKCNPAHNQAILALARIHLSSGDISETEQKCASILRADPFNSEAGDILVRLMLNKEHYESAIIHFKQNLERDPNHYFSLAQLIRLLRCAGQSDEAQQYVLIAQKASSTSHTHAGLYYCKGLLARYLNNPHEAVQMLNRARSDPEWVKPAICLLIEIYLNIGNELVWEEVNLEGTNPSSEEGIKAAWKLLGENRLLDGQSINQLVLECYGTMATRQKADIEFALGRLTESVPKEEQKVSVLLAMATGLTLLKQTAKAKNQLRIIDRMVYKWEDGEAFERAWLMLANILMQVHVHCDAANVKFGEVWQIWRPEVFQRI